MPNLSANIEAVLLVSNRPMTVREISEICQADAGAVQQAIKELTAAYDQRGDSGIQLTRAGNQVQLVSSGACAPVVQRFLKQETTGELTRAQLETLTTIAYRGPVTRAELEQIRGVNCAIILRNLQVRGLIEGSGGDAKNPIPRYSVSMDFLKHLGLATVEQLPDYARLHQLDVVNRLLETPQTQA
ncbi:MAG: SMC-Scp complex subunit ScpB [Patescibacteria group bacterium]|nr:SMC-Scp complex subunit ScpB [Patescibacteria group bacterium]